MYDENSNPRSLSEDMTDEEYASVEDQVHVLRQDISNRGRVLALLKSVGWKDLTELFLKEYEAGIRAIRSNQKAPNIESVTYIRGQLDTYDHILTMKERLEQLQKLQQAQVSSLEDLADSGTLVEQDA